MKSFIVFALIIAGISALPPQLAKGILKSDQRLVTDTIASNIAEVSQSIRDAGLDPVSIPHKQASYALPVPVLFNFFGQIDGFNFHGLSNILITRLTFAALTLRLRLDLKLPLIEATLDNAQINAILFDEEINGYASGRLAIRDITVETDIRVRISIISGVSINSISAALKVGAIESDLAVSALGIDFSPFLNNVLGNIIPNTLNNFERDINKLLDIVLLDVINDIL